MEKEKKVKKEEKSKLDVQENIVMVKDEKRLVKFVSLLTTFFATSIAILIFVFSVMASLSIAQLPKEDLVNNNIVVTLLAKLNNYSVSDAKELINSMNNRFGFILFEIVIPTIAFIGAMLLLIALGKRLIDFVRDVKTESDLINTKKLGEIQDIISILSLVLLTTLVLFDQPSIIFYILIEFLMCVIYVLFKKCVILKKR